VTLSCSNRANWGDFPGFSKNWTKKSFFFEKIISDYFSHRDFTPGKRPNAHFFGLKFTPDPPLPKGYQWDNWGGAAVANSSRIVPLVQ
jgi:hypothetical protein